MTISIGALVMDLEHARCAVEPCGSRVTCDPPPMDTDADYLVEVRSIDGSGARAGDISRIVQFLEGRGFAWEGGEHYQMQLTGNFMSFRCGDINLIVTANTEFAAKHRLATSLCKSFNLMPKAHRIALFQAVLYGQFYDPVANRNEPAPVSVPDFTIRPVRAPSPVLDDSPF